MAQVTLDDESRCPLGETAHPTLPVGISNDPVRRLGVGHRLISLRLKRVAAFSARPRRANDIFTKHEVTS